MFQMELRIAFVLCVDLVTLAFADGVVKDMGFAKK